MMDMECSSTHHSLHGGGARTPSVNSSGPKKSKSRSSGSSRSFRRSGKKEEKFEAYMSIGEVQQSLKKGELVEGILRINPRNYEDSYITAPDGEMDIYIEGLHDRNRAMNGDRVAVQIKPPSDWKILKDRLNIYRERHSGVHTPHHLVPESSPRSEGKRGGGNNRKKKRREPGTSFGQEERNNTQAANNWNGTDGWNNMQPAVEDTLELLGLDAFKKQVEDLIHQKIMPKPEKTPSPASNQQGDVVIDTWATTGDSNNPVVHPADLLDPSETPLLGLQLPMVPEEQPPEQPDVYAVAPEELSGNEYESDSCSLESGLSYQADRYIEDLLYRRDHQDSRNNNVIPPSTLPDSSPILIPPGIAEVVAGIPQSLIPAANVTPPPSSTHNLADFSYDVLRKELDSLSDEARHPDSPSAPLAEGELLETTSRDPSLLPTGGVEADVLPVDSPHTSANYEPVKEQLVSSVNSPCDPASRPASDVQSQVAPTTDTLTQKQETSLLKDSPDIKGVDVSKDAETQSEELQENEHPTDTISSTMKQSEESAGRIPPTEKASQTEISKPPTSSVSSNLNDPPPQVAKDASNEALNSSKPMPTCRTLVSLSLEALDKPKGVEKPMVPDPPLHNKASEKEEEASSPEQGDSGSPREQELSNKADISVREVETLQDTREVSQEDVANNQAKWDHPSLEKEETNATKEPTIPDELQPESPLNTNNLVERGQCLIELMGDSGILPDSLETLEIILPEDSDKGDLERTDLDRPASVASSITSEKTPSLAEQQPDESSSSPDIIEQLGDIHEKAPTAIPVRDSTLLTSAPELPPLAKRGDQPKTQSDELIDISDAVSQPQDSLSEANVASVDDEASKSYDEDSTSLPSPSGEEEEIDLRNISFGVLGDHFIPLTELARAWRVPPTHVPSNVQSESNYVVLQQDALTHQVIVPKTPEVKGESSESMKSEERTEATITNEAPVDTAPIETTELSQDLNSKSSDDHHTQDSSELPVNTPEPLEPSSSLENDKVTAAVSLEDSGSPEKLSGQAVELNETSSGPIESTEPAGTTTPQSEEVEKSEEPTSREELVETQELEDPKSDIQECTEAALEDAVGITERVPKENTSQEDDKTTALNSETQGQEPEKSVEVVEVSMVPLDDAETSSATSPDSGIILEESNLAGGAVEDKIPEEIVSQTQSDNQATDSSPLNETEEVPTLPDPRPLMVNPSMEEVKPEKSDEQSSSSVGASSTSDSDATMKSRADSVPAPTTITEDLNGVSPDHHRIKGSPVKEQPSSPFKSNKDRGSPFKQDPNNPVQKRKKPISSFIAQSAKIAQSTIAQIDPVKTEVPVITDVPNEITPIESPKVRKPKKNRNYSETPEVSYPKLQGTSSEHSTPVPSSNSDFSKPKRKKKNKNKNMIAMGENQKQQAAQEVVPLSSENFMNQTANSNKPQQTEPREIKTKSKKRKSKKKEEAAAAAASNENRAPPALQDSKPVEQPKAKNEVRKNKLTRNTQGLKENGSLPMDTWTVEQLMKHPLGEKFLQKTGKVVCILEKKSISLTSGHIKLQNDHNNKWALFVPNDHRFPRMLIPMEQCPTGFYSRPGDFTNVLFLASLVEWGQQETFAKGQLIKSLGNSGEIEAETQALLVENAVDESDFPPEALEGLPLEESWVIPEEEYKRRRDFRKTCVFTIDPSTARDLDDALSCVPLKNGNFEVGVHIADVSFFVKEDTKLDVIAQDRGNSVYLVQKVVPMLPRILCERLCSLNPDSDKLTFSVVWEMTPEGTHVGEAWFGRTVIRSCAQLSYEHAQDLIRGDCSPDSLPPLNGGFTHADVSNAVLNLHSMAVHMRQRRFDSGALRLDQVKLQFALDDFDGMPFGFCALQQKDSHRLVEEFMLYANMAVARQIYDHYPDKALLRRHPSPQARVLNDVVEICESLGIHIDSSSAGSLQKSLMESISSGPEKVPDMLKMAALTSMCTKSMMCALYFCSGCLEDPAEYHHYALNVPLYTHFTSPIRRYPDILVHRLLAASLNYQATPTMSAKEMQVCAEHCNDTKYNARRVSEMSNELFLNLFIKKLGRLSSKGMVMSILDHSFDVLVDKLGVVKRVYCDKLEYGYMRQNGVPQLTIKWKIRGGRRVIQQTLKVFSVVDLSLSPIAPDSLKIQTVLEPPSS